MIRVATNILDWIQLRLTKRFLPAARVRVAADLVWFVLVCRTFCGFDRRLAVHGYAARADSCGIVPANLHLRQLNDTLLLLVVIV